ncbi:MAG: ABC transporter substrate-binding protein [Chloroflexota bacterium]
MFIKHISFVFALALFLAACSPAAPTQANPAPATTAAETAPTQAAATGFTVTDALGRQVRFESVPQRIALAGKANLLVADALYLFPQAVERIAVLGKGTQGTGNFLAVIDPNYEGKSKYDNDVSSEQLAAEKPDAVILKSYLAESLGAPLETLGIPVVYVDFETPEQYYRDLATLGQLFQDEGRAQKVAEFYRGRVERITQKTSGLKDEEKPRTLLLYYNDKDGEVAFNVPPMSWMQTILVETAGGNPIWKDANLGKGWTKVTLEQVAAWDADQIYIISYFRPVNEVVELLKADPQWQSLRAVQEGKLYGFASDMISWDQADSRWIMGLTWLATKLHPDLFSDIDIQAEAQTFFTELYGISQASFSENIRPLFGGDLP